MFKVPSPLISNWGTDGNPYTKTRFARIITDATGVRNRLNAKASLGGQGLLAATGVRDNGG